MNGTSIYVLKNIHGYVDLKIGDEVKLKKNNRPYYIIEMIMNLGSATLTLDDGISIITVSEGDIIREKK